MQIKKGTPVKLKTFLGTATASKSIEEREIYWKLIGQSGKVIDDTENGNGRVLVLFNRNLNEFGVENHNPVENSLWIKKSDLELDQYSIHLKKLEKEILGRTSFMNNTKWFKLFSEIENEQYKIKSAYIKFLLVDRQYKFRFGGFNETGFGDVGELGPFQFKEIEWILIPEKYETERCNRNEKLTAEITIQPLAELEKTINSLGQFEYDITKDGLKIYGYK